VPNPEVVASFDHFVGAGEQRGRNSEAEGLRGFEIDDERILCRRLHRKVDRLLAHEDAVDIARGPTELVEEVSAVREKTASSGIKAGVVDGRQAMLGRQRDDQLATRRLFRTAGPIQSA
jgi:hypothetical protein